MKPISYWKCIYCGELYNSAVQAAGCCTDAEQVYVCSECKKRYPANLFLEALGCCTMKKPDTTSKGDAPNATTAN